jgi:hypothetical protein
LDSLLDCGFNCVGNYLCYKSIIWYWFLNVFMRTFW